MFEILLKSKADDADKTTGLARENKSAEERKMRERRECARDDDIRRSHAEKVSESQRNLLALVTICVTSDQPFSAGAAATGLMQVANAPSPATCTSATNKGPVSVAPAALPSASSGPPRLSAAPMPLAIMDVLPEVTLTDELVAANNKIKISKAMLAAMMMRLGSQCANMSPEAIEDGECVKGIRSKIVVLEARIVEIAARANEITLLLLNRSLT